MVNHLLNGMILQVPSYKWSYGAPTDCFFYPQLPIYKVIYIGLYLHL